MRFRRVVPLVSEALGEWRRAGASGVRAWWSRKLRERLVFDAEEERVRREERAYARWIAEVEPRLPAPTAPRSRPLVSVLMPVYETPEPWLRRAIESVLAQSYERWELCIADDASRVPHVRSVLESFAKKDPRVKVVFRETNGHISACSNSALELASGDFLVLLDHDDELAKDALARVVAALDEHPETDLLFSDEDKIDEKGRRFAPFFKGGWNPDLMNVANAFGHLGVYRTALVRAVGGFRPGFEGTQDWDLVHRCAARTAPERIRHVPHVLYHFRAIPGSTALEGSSKPYLLDAALRALAERFAKSGVHAARGTGATQLRLRYPVPPGIRAAIISQASIPVASSTVGIEHVRLSGWSARELDSAVRAARAQVVLLVGPGLDAIDAESVEELVSHAIRPEVGCVGGRVVDRRSFVRHGGWLLDPESIVTDPNAGFPEESDGYHGRAAALQDVSAVSASCLAIRREVFLDAGGFDAANLPGALFDVDLCLRLLERERRVVFTPHASARGDVAFTPSPSASELAYVRRRFSLADDPLDGSSWRALRAFMREGS